jgi:tRNA(Leu) C34 or U34 (ribose-2'-O)-methylase TrmL
MKNIHPRNLSIIETDNSKHERVFIGLTNPKNPINVGSVMRAAGNYGVEQVFFTGTRYAKAAKYQGKINNTDTQNVSGKIPLTKTEHFNDLANTLENIPSSTKVICVDLIEGAIPLPHFEHPEHAIYIFGPEDSTVPQDIIDNADAVVYVPTVGCMNLAASVNVLLYDRLAKSLILNNEVEPNNDLIRKSRDKNNRTIVK